MYDTRLASTFMYMWTTHPRMTSIQLDNSSCFPLLRGSPPSKPLSLCRVYRCPGSGGRPVQWCSSRFGFHPMNLEQMTKLILGLAPRRTAEANMRHGQRAQGIVSPGRAWWPLTTSSGLAPTPPAFPIFGETTCRSRSALRFPTSKPPAAQPGGGNSITVRYSGKECSLGELRQLRAIIASAFAAATVALAAQIRGNFAIVKAHIGAETSGRPRTYVTDYES